MKLMSKKGFTLIELLVTITIIAILSAIGLIVYTSVIKQGRDSKRQSDLRSIQSALEQYFADKFYYPQNNYSTCSNGKVAFNATSPCKLVDPLNTKTYLNAVPGDPSFVSGESNPHPQYCYKPLKNTQGCEIITADCNNDSKAEDKCASYCLYAKLENIEAGSETCGSATNYNLKITPP